MVDRRKPQDKRTHCHKCGLVYLDDEPDAGGWHLLDDEYFCPDCYAEKVHRREAPVTRRSFFWATGF